MRLRLLLARFYHRFKTSNFTLLLLIIILSLIFFYFLNLIFTIREIQVEGFSEKKHLVGVENFAGRNILFLDVLDIEKKMKANNPQIRDIKIKKILPQTVRLVITLYQPKVILVGSNIYFYLSNDGRILFKEKRQSLPLPLIYYYQKFNEYAYQTGTWISYRDLNIAIRIVSLLTNLGFFVERVDISGNDMILFKIGEKEIVLTTEKDEELIEYELTQIIKQFKIEGRDFKSLDLRFKKPVVKF